jgi:hypothetical protein
LKFFIYQVWSPFFLLLFILFEIIYEIRFFFNFYPSLTFLSVNFGSHSFNKLEKRMKTLINYSPTHFS